MPSAPLDWLFSFGAPFVAASLAATVVTKTLRDTWAARLRLTEPEVSNPTPTAAVAKVGGLGIWVAIVLVGSGLLLGSSNPLQVPASRPLFAIVLGALAICCVGCWDDLSDLSPGQKLFLQALVSAGVWFAGARLVSLNLPLLGTLTLTPQASFVLTLLWFVAITNALNLADGADGVAGGVTFAAIAALFLAALLTNQYRAAQILALAGGAVLGFLLFNFPPATVFLGDAGSLSLGFLLAGVGLVVSSTVATVAVLAIPVVALGLPVLDTGLAIARRLLRGDRIYAGDLGHVHHRLQKLGHSPRQVALILYGVSALLALTSLVFLSSGLLIIAAVLVALGIASVVAVVKLRFPEFQELGRLLGRLLSHRESIARGVAIREAATSLQAADTREQVFDALADAFSAARIDQVELRLVALPAFGRRSVSQAGDLAWNWHRDNWHLRSDATDTTRQAGYELRIPVKAAGDGTSLGELTLAQTTDESLPSDLEIICHHLVPSLATTLQRLQAMPGHVSYPESTREPRRAS